MKIGHLIGHLQNIREMHGPDIDVVVARGAEADSLQVVQAWHMHSAQKRYRSIVIDGEQTKQNVILCVLN